MPAVSSIIAAVGVASTVAGVGLSYEASKKQSEAQANVAQNQYITSGLQEAGVGLQEQGLKVQQEQQQLQISTQRQAIQLQQQQDDIRRASATTDATRRIREIVRQGILAKSQSLSTATNQGVSATGGSAVKGAYGSIQGQTDVSATGVTQALQAGNSIYDLNKSISSTYLNAQDKNAGLVAQSGGIQSQILGVQKQIYSVGGNTALSYRDAAAYGSIAAFGSGLSSLGGAVIRNQDNATNLTNYFIGAFGNKQQSYPTYGTTGDTGLVEGGVWPA